MTGENTDLGQGAASGGGDRPDESMKIFLPPGALPPELNIRLSLQIVPGEGNEPMRVRWAVDPEDAGAAALGGSGRRSPGGARPAGGSWKRWLPVGIALLIVGSGTLAAFVVRPGSLARGVSADPPLQTVEQTAAANAPAPAETGTPVVPADASTPPAAAGAATEAEPPRSAVTASAEPAQLRIAGDLPPDARIFADGREVWRRTLWLTPGSHRLEVRAEGFETAGLTVRLQAGENRDWTPELRPVVAHAAADVAVATPARERPPVPRAVPSAVAPIVEPVAAATPAPLPPAPDPEQALAVSIAGVRGTLDGLARALESRRVEQVRALYPTIPAEEQRRWRQFLESRDVTDLSVMLANVQTPVVRGDYAEATFDLVLRFRSSYGGPVHRTTRFGATFANDSRAWSVRSLQATDP